MKRVLLFLLIWLLLSGCMPAQEPEAETTEPVAEFTKPVSLYVADSSVEQQTGGAVKVFAPEEDCTGIAAMDGKILLVTDLSKLILMDSENGDLGTSIKVGEEISSQTQDFTASHTGVTYYREEGRELVFLDGLLRQKTTVEIPEGITGRPCVSLINQEVYYNKNNKIWAQDLRSGEVRLVFQQGCRRIEPVALQQNDTILTCTFVDGYGVESMLYMDAATGTLLEESAQLMGLQTGSQQYLVRRKDGIVEQLIYGAEGGENHILDLNVPVHAAFSLHGGYHYALTEGALELDFYDFITGTHSSHVRIEGVTELISVASDSKYLWILASGGTAQRLYRWDVTKSSTGSTDSFLAPLYTRENPDVQGLEQCAQRAQALTDLYGISVTVAPGVTGGYEVTGEYQVPALSCMLDELQTVLAQFPEGFLQESLSEGGIHISFVRTISGGREVVQFYDSSEAYILVAASEHLRQNILRGLAYIIDSHVLGGSQAYDAWKDLNPAGFDYDYSYYFYTGHADSAYLTDESRAFVDAYAMTFPYEDRCLVFAYAMMENNGAYFASDIMQAKLSVVCQGIRETYEDYGGPLPWEQYLAK